MGQDLAPSGKFDSIHPFGQGLDNRAVDLNRSCQLLLVFPPDRPERLRG